MNKLKLYAMVFAKYIFTFCFAGGLYLFIETFYRGYTFLEMYYLAGIIGIIVQYLNDDTDLFTYESDFLLQLLVYTCIGTMFEGLCGYFYNYDYHIWDYRGLPGSFFFDQCNIFFVFAWFLVFLFVVPILDYISWRVFNYMPDTPPYYKILGKKVFQFKK